MQGSDRPLKRRFIKSAFAVFAGLKRAHWQEGWPGLSLTPHSIQWRGKDVAHRVFGALPKNADELLILGSGPSLARLSTEDFPQNASLLLNGALSLHRQIAPLAAVIEDERFVWRHFEMIAEAADHIPLWLLSPAALRAIFEQDCGLLSGKKIEVIDNIAKPFRLPKRKLMPSAGLLSDGQGSFVSLLPDQGVVGAGTVAFSAAQFALAARPKRLSFAGVELRTANAPRFYEDKAKMAPSGIVGALPRILPHFKLLLSAAKSQNIECVSYSTQSALCDLGAIADSRFERKTSLLD